MTLQPLRTCIHRVGRSGRAEARGLASTLASGARVSELRRIERVLRLRIERKKIEYNHLVRQWRCRENNLPSRTLTAMPGEVFTTDIASVPLAWHSVGEYMALFVLRLRNGSCVVVEAGDDAAARQRAKDLRPDVEIATVRELESFAAQFLLTDDGELKSILLDEKTRRTISR